MSEPTEAERKCVELEVGHVLGAMTDEASRTIRAHYPHNVEVATVENGVLRFS